MASGDMNLIFIGTTSQNGGCPTMYEVEGTGEFVVQGVRLSEQARAQLRDLACDEDAVVVPRELLTRFTPKG
ncbi:hypothetical protein [Actinopolymorpha pittospori]|uniref:Uncharacterized protein n=1 Tax=Actinopolymorpha pittospori TaxID=648752 RepID=A0A927MYH6_9ACTN|nr:hypothetical protein [Actinopolymorpha pittospori]MBE1608861.1 hypothetical protein [Actinopolymorpha pittospori]